jgi:integrase/recombinase XerD
MLRCLLWSEVLMRATVTLCEQVNVGTAEKAEMKVRPVVYRHGQPIEPEGIVPGSRPTYYLRFSEDGRRVTHSLKTSNLKVAQLAHNQALARFVAGIRPVIAESPILADFRENAPHHEGGTWRALYHGFVADQDQKVIERLITESSRRRYLRSLKVLNKWFESRVTFLTEIDAELFNTFKRERIASIIAANGTTGSSYRIDVKAAKMMFNLAIEKGWMKVNPVQKMKTSKKRKDDEESYKADPYSRAELHAMRKHLSWEKKNGQQGDVTLMFWLLYQTGLRRSDAGGLKWREVNLKAGKTGKISTVALKNGRKVNLPIAPELRSELEKEIQRRYSDGKPADNDYVLFNYTPSDPGQVIYDSIVRLGERAGITRATPHRFRDSYAAVCFLKGMSTEQVAANLGDTEAVVSKHYSEYIPERQEQADEKFLSVGDPLLVGA